MNRTMKTAVGSCAAALLVSAVPMMAKAVDGVILITQARALAGGITPGDAPGFPVTLSQPGSYRLAGNLTVATANVNAIFVEADNVSIDLNGFTVFGPGKANGTAAGIASDQTDAPGGGAMTIMNGVVRDMGGAGIAIDSAAIVEGQGGEQWRTRDLPHHRRPHHAQPGR